MKRKFNDIAKTVVFLHIPKSAGSTIRDITRRQYSPHNIFTVPSGEHQESTLENLKHINSFKNGQSFQQSFQLIEGHFGFGVHELITNPSSYFTFLRQPISRFISAYTYIKKEKGHKLHQIIQSQSMNLDDYVKSNLIEQERLDNVQVRFLSGTQGRINQEETLIKSDLEKAKSNLADHFMMTGIVEEFDKSLLLLSKQLGWKNIFYTRQNKSKKTDSEQSLAQETKTLIQKYNELDLELYQYGYQLFQNLLENQDNEFEREFDRFTQNNGKLFGRLASLTGSTFSKARKGIYKFSGL